MDVWMSHMYTPPPPPPPHTHTHQEAEVGTKEIKELQAHNNELQSQVDMLKGKCEEGEERLLVQTQRHREEMRRLSDKHKQESTTMEAQYKVGGRGPASLSSGWAWSSFSLSGWAWSSFSLSSGWAWSSFSLSSGWVCPASLSSALWHLHAS